MSRARSPGLLATGVAVGLMGSAFGSLALLLPALALIILAVVAWSWVSLSARKSAVTRTVDRTVMQEGEAAGFILTVTRGRLPCPGRLLFDAPDARPTPVSRGARLIARGEIRLARRGRHTLQGACLQISDPLGICRRRLCSTPSDVLVLPRVEPVHLSGDTGDGALGPRVGGASPHAAALEVDSLRPYRPGAPASRIHWPTVARTGTVMEHRLISDGDRRPLLVLDACAPASEEALDQALRAAASLAVHLAGHGGGSILLPGERRPVALEADLHTWPALHARMALVQPGTSGPSLARLAHAGIVLWVTASRRPRDGLRRAGVRGGYLVTPFPLAGGAVAFTVGGCTGQPVGLSPRAQAA